MNILGDRAKVIGVYGEQDVSLRRNAWYDFRMMAPSANTPWIVFGLQRGAYT